METIRIITTEDGSHSLFNEKLNETYHSIHGAVQESNHVFIKHGLEYVMEYFTKPVIHILEIGFGTGLNALLTLQRVFETNQSIHYTTLEAFPVEEDVWSKLNYADTDPSKLWFEKLHQSNWNQWTEIVPNFQLQKLHIALQDIEFDQDYFDLVYFDAFAPNKQPEMWEVSMFEKIVRSMKHDGALVTYCAKGQLKRDLKSLQLRVESLPGPPGKREMVRAKK